MRTRKKKGTSRVEPIRSDKETLEQKAMRLGTPKDAPGPQLSFISEVIRVFTGQGPVKTK